MWATNLYHFSKSAHQWPHLLKGDKMLSKPPSLENQGGRCGIKMFLKRKKCHAYKKEYVLIGKDKLGQRNIFPSWQSSETLICSPFIPSPFPALGKVEASACLGVSSAGFACNYFSWICRSQSIISSWGGVAASSQEILWTSGLLTFSIWPWHYLLWTG